MMYRTFLVSAVCAGSIIVSSGRALGDTDVAPASPVIVCDGQEGLLQTYLEIHRVLFSERDTSRVEEFYAPEIISHNNDRGGSGARTVNIEYLRAMWDRSREQDPERILADDLIICAGNYVIVRTTIHGADNTGIGSFAATGKPYSITATDIYRFENGVVVERWGNADLVSMFNQIGYTFVPKDTPP